MSSTATSNAITPDLIIPFMNAVTQVFQKMVGVPATVQKPYLKTQTASTYDVCGIIGLSGQVAGSVVVSFAEAAAVNLVESFSGTRFKVSDPDFADAIGELANMIAGGAKQHLGGVASISTPSVVIGKGYAIAGMSDIPCVVIPCTSPRGDFAVEICIKRHKAA
ncbi:MAG: chemotaxis protein CheX [Phycisphaeraceae bacterium]|jgi:chemotaxis protein CheX|nr:chemotaxis protein CheX [Phycisphaeraceae bacterium]